MHFIQIDESHSEDTLCSLFPRLFHSTFPYSHFSGKIRESRVREILWHKNDEEWRSFTCCTGCLAVSVCVAVVRIA